MLYVELAMSSPVCVVDTLLLNVTRDIFSINFLSKVKTENFLQSIH